METVPKDVVELMTKELSPSELINFCISNISPNVKLLCNDNNFWVRRYQKDFRDFKDFTTKFEDINAKKKYLFLFSIFSKQAEIATASVMDIFGNFKKFLTKEYKDSLYNYFFLHFIEIFQVIPDIRRMTRIEIWIWVEDYSDKYHSYENFRNNFVPPPILEHIEDDDNFWIPVLNDKGINAIIAIFAALL